jgi:hypothetical protein
MTRRITGRRLLGPTLASVAASLLLVGSTPATSGAQAPELSARVWLDRGEDPVLGRGERVRLYYRTSADAFVSIFQIDTNGTVRVLFPRSPDEDHYARGGRDYRLLFPRSTWWTVEDDPGVGYFFAVASPEPFDFSSFRYSHFQGGWDLSFVGRTAYADPYVAMDEYIARLIPDWEYVPYALDFAAYHVERRYDYPRFLCYDCHGFRPYSAWNPYFFTCSTYRVVVYDDPYYYPITRYRGDRVVWVRPSNPGQPRFVFKERARGEPGTPVVASRPPVADRPGVGGTAAPRRSTGGVGSGGVAPLPRSSQPGSVARPSSAVQPGRAPLPLGRPSDALPGRGSAAPTGRVAPVPGSARPSTGGASGRAQPPTPTGPDRARPVLERRPPAGGGGSSASPPPARVRPPTGGSAGSSGGTPARRPPVVRKPTGGGGSAPAARPSGSVRPSSPAARSSNPPARPPVRRPGGGGP